MKKLRLPEKKAGIWLDQGKAFIISIVGNSYPVIEKIRSGVESRIRVPGESKVFSRYGQTVIDGQEKKQRRQRHQRHRYFNKIMDSIGGSDFIYLFGPSEARHELNNEIENSYLLKGKVVAIKHAARMTQEQMVQAVINFFDGDEFRLFKRNLKKQKLVH